LAAVLRASVFFNNAFLLLKLMLHLVLAKDNTFAFEQNDYLISDLLFRRPTIVLRMVGTIIDAHDVNGASAVRCNGTYCDVTAAAAAETDVM